MATIIDARAWLLLSSDDLQERTSYRVKVQSDLETTAPDAWKARDVPGRARARNNGIRIREPEKQSVGRF
jgi:hypothetical protein